MPKYYTNNYHLFEILIYKVLEQCYIKYDINFGCLIRECHKFTGKVAEILSSTESDTMTDNPYSG